MTNEIFIYDEDISELAMLLYCEPQDSNAQKFNVEHFDFSIESLKHVEEYLLQSINENWFEETYNRIILRCGAYLGEVIRRNARREYHWFDYETAILFEPVIADYEESIGIKFVLSNQDRTVFPMSKIEKFIDDYEDNSLINYAQVLSEI